ncbi:hypothetical protein [Desulfopila aestuarii]|uniref:Uncharacterized protein n=1 Tax=Desulfopila aestuarii DSM 18488 TaxID=1121416 RepID=A0A1M7YG97_9BACT|nr:hypothetical protein [Desulfopila aestuarii]SHO51664.1 hypothetical protein SAMN02745220_04135 [Desulfopila aestuarii DSM 18488]
MSIRAIARDLYRAQQQVDKLEKEMAAASLADQDLLRGELRQAKKEMEMIKRMLDGEKESGKFRNKFQGFGK